MQLTEVVAKIAVVNLWHDEVDNDAGIIEGKQTENTYEEFVEVGAVEAGALGMTQE